MLTELARYYEDDAKDWARTTASVETALAVVVDQQTTNSARAERFAADLRHRLGRLQRKQTRRSQEP